MDSHWLLSYVPGERSSWLDLKAHVKARLEIRVIGVMIKLDFFSAVLDIIISFERIRG